MTPFVSVALIQRGGKIVFKPPRKERPTDLTQARKAAARFWAGKLADGDTLVKVIVLREYSGKLEISERGHNAGHDKPWVAFEMEIATAVKEPHLAAALGEIGVDPDDQTATMPDVLVINGFTYRRDI